MPTALCTPGTWYAGFSGDAPAIDPRTGNRIYGRTFQEAQQNARAAQNGGSIGPQPSWAAPPSRDAAPVRLSPTRRPAPTATLEPDPQAWPAFDGPVVGISIGQSFPSKYGPTILEVSDPNAMFQGTEIHLAGRRVAVIGDGTAVLRVSGSQLLLLVCLSAKAPGVAGLVEAVRGGGVAFEAVACGAPDEWRTVDGVRTAIIYDWALSRIEFGDAEAGSRCVLR